MSDPSAQGASWQPDPSGRHQLRYWDGQTWTDAVSDDGVQSSDPLSAPPPPAAAGDGYTGQSARGPIGRPSNAGTVVLLSIVTLGIYTLIWTYRQYEDFKAYSREGIGRSIRRVVRLFVRPIRLFSIPR